jgi:hypothetical protein
MRIEGNHTLKGKPEKVWNTLTDPEILSKCIPGCEKLEKTEEDTYKATLTMGIGSIKGTYTGQVKLIDKQPYSSFKMIVEGKGGPGFVKGEGVLNLQEQNGNTLISYQGDAQVGGTLASVGQRMIQASAKMIIGQFFTALDMLQEQQSQSSETSSGGTSSGSSSPSPGFFFKVTLRYLWNELKKIFKLKH